MVDTVKWVIRALLTGDPERRPKGIFPPVNVVQALLPGGVHTILPLTSPLEGFCT